MSPRPSPSVLRYAVAATAVGLVMAVGAPLAAVAVTLTPEQTAPQLPKVAPNDPTVLFVEDFEHGVGTTPILLDAYVGANGETYTADPAWISPSQCNGIITSASSTDMSACTNNAKIKGLARVLGQVTGTDEATNHVVSAWTESRNLPANSVQIESRDAFSLGQSGRFVSFGVSAAAGACVGYAHPLLDFMLIDGDTERRVSARPLNPCTDARSQTIGAYKAGEYVSSGGVLFDGDDLRWRLRNAQSSSSGNDAAIDRVTIVDSTPTLAHSFAGSPIVGDTARMTITVQNTSEHGSKPGWSFTEALPEGLTVAAEPDVQTTCTNPTTTIDAGASSVSVAGDLAIDAADCAVSFDVGAARAGTYTVDADSVTDHVGVDLPGVATVTFAPEANLLEVTEEAVVSGGNEDAVADLGEQVAFETMVRNAGNVLVRDLRVSGAHGDVTCDVDELAVGGTATCASAPREVTQDDLDRGSIDDAVTVAAESRAGAAVTGAATAVATTTPRAPGLTVSATAALPTGTAAPVAGDRVTVSVELRNSGNTTLRDLVAMVDGRSDMSVVCPSGPLAPGADVACEVDGYRLTQDDVDAGSVGFAVSATATAGATAVTADTTTAVSVPRAPAITSTLVATLDDTATVHAGDTVALEAVVRNTGNVRVHGVTMALVGQPDLGITCDAGAIAPGESMPCALAGYALTQADIDAGRVTFTVDAGALTPDDQRVAAAASDEIAVQRIPGVEAVITAHRVEDGRPAAGDHLVAAATIRNTGNVSLAELVASFESDAEGIGSGADVSCDVGSLAPGLTLDCAVTEYELTQQDIERGSVAYPFVVSASAPGSTARVSDRDEVVVGLDGAGSLSLSGVAVQGIVAGADGAGAGGARVAGDSGSEPLALDAGAVLRPGQAFGVRYEVTNTGNLAVDALQHAEDSEVVVCEQDVLAPGERTTCRLERDHVVTDAEAEEGEAAVVAAVRGQVGRPDGSAVASAAGASTTAPAAPLRAVRLASATGPVWVFSPQLRTVVTAEPAPIELAFTGSEVGRVIPIAALVSLAGVVLLVLARRRRAA